MTHTSRTRPWRLHESGRMSETDAADPEAQPRDIGRKVAIGRLFASLLSLGLLGLLAFAGYHERDYRQMARGLDAELAALRRLRWEPPPLRVAAGDGNAADDIYAALSGWKPLSPAMRESLASKVYYGQQPSAADNTALAERAPALRALRTAAFQRWARTDLVAELGDQMRVPDYSRAIEASLGLLINAEAAGAEECLQRAAEVIRIGQSLVPAAPLEAVSVSTHMTALAARVIARCAQGTDLNGLRRAAHELRMLATHPAPIGSCIEFEEIVTAMQLRNQAALSNKLSPVDVIRTAWLRPQLMAAWTPHQAATRFRRITAERYPDALEEWKREQDVRLQSEFAQVREASEHVLGRMLDDMRGQALLRMLSVGLHTLAERAYRGMLPPQPAGLRDPQLLDPFRGQAFGYRVASNGVELTLWSVGEDFRDEAGSDDWAQTGPRDVTLHFPLGPRPAPQIARRRL